jgi:hypothetical protein
MNKMSDTWVEVFGADADEFFYHWDSGMFDFRNRVFSASRIPSHISVCHGKPRPYSMRRVHHVRRDHGVSQHSNESIGD